MSGIRIKDIAQLAGVSVGTVDRVIHKRGEVSEATRERILLLLAEHDYRPDIAGRSLAMKRKLCFATLMPGTQPGHSFWSMPERGLQTALRDLADYHIEVRSMSFDQNKPESFTSLAHDFPFEQVDGLLFAPVFRRESMDFIASCKENSLPVVLFNSFLEEAEVDSYVGQNAYQSGRVAGKLLQASANGQGRLAIINMAVRKDHYEHITDRERGFRSYFRELQGEERLVTIDLNGADRSVMLKQLKDFLGKESYSGIFVTNSRVHLLATLLKEGQDRGCAVVGYDLLPENRKALEAGAIDYLISQKPETQAHRGLTTLFNLVVFEQKAEPMQWLPIDIITKENLAYYGTTC